jgi:cobalt-zinc-cadmium efflux system outer membrane protein
LLWAQQSAPTLSTVDDLVRAGISNNKDLAAARQRLEEAKGLARQARVVPSPVLDLTGATGNPLGSPDENQYGVGLSQSIEAFGKRGKRARVADLDAAKAEADLQERSAQLAYEIRTTYSEVTAERHKFKLLTDLIGLNQETLRLTEARVREGDVPRLEASLLRVEISRAEVARKSAQGRLTSAEIQLRRLAGIDQSSAIPEADSGAAPASTLDDLKQRALSNRADLKSARLEEEVQSAAVDLAKAEWKPDLSLTAGYSRQSSAFEGLFALNGNGTLSPIRDQVNILERATGGNLP